MTDTESEKKIKEKKVENRIKINPKLGEAVEEIGGEIIEMTEVEEEKKPLPKTKMFRQSGNLGRDAISTPIDPEKRQKAYDRSKKIIKTLNQNEGYGAEQPWLRSEAKAVIMIHAIVRKSMKQERLMKEEAARAAVQIHKAMQARREKILVKGEVLLWKRFWSEIIPCLINNKKQEEMLIKQEC